MSIVVTFINVFAQVLTYAILIRVVLTWFPIGPNNAFYALIYQVTEPMLAPLRRIIPRVGMLDFAPMVAIILLGLLQFVIRTL